MHSRDITKIKSIRSNDPHDWVCYSESGGDPRKTCQVINEPTSHKMGRSSIKELSLNGVSITNSTVLPNAFNDQFSTIGPKLAGGIPLNNGPSFQEYISGQDSISSPLVDVVSC